MKMKKLNIWLTLIANIAVVAGIAFLAVEVSQNTASVRAAAYQTWAEAKIVLFETAQTNDSMSRVIVQGLDDPASLTKDNYVQFAFWASQHVLAAQTAYFLHQDGIIPDSVYDIEIETTARMVSNSKGGSQWWKAGARTQFSEEFVGVIEAEFNRPSDVQRWVFTEGRGFHPAE